MTYVQQAIKTYENAVTESDYEAFYVLCGRLDRDEREALIVGLGWDMGEYADWVEYGNGDDANYTDDSWGDYDDPHYLV